MAWTPNPTGSPNQWLILRCVWGGGGGGRRHATQSQVPSWALATGLHTRSQPQLSDWLGD